MKPQKAPNFTISDLNGETFSLSDYKGEVVLLEFWATWCPPCRLSMPAVEKLGEDYRGKGLHVISLSLDENPDTVRSYLTRNPSNNRMAMAGDNVDTRYGVRGIPAFYIIDQNGYVTRSWGGYHPSLPSVWRKEIDRLLKL